MKNASDFVDRLSKLKFKNTFNPYSEGCSEIDQDNAPLIRRRNLQLVLEAAIDSSVDSLWIARDLGYRGGRRTGLALTDEAHLADHAKLYGNLALRRATKGPAIAERTANVVWQTLTAINKPIFLWNVFPLHPHEPNSPQSNRCHTRSEREACAPYLSWLIERLQPKLIVSIGRDAANALSSVEVAASTVRHPSYGGQGEFIEGVRALYGLTTVQKSPAQTHLQF